MDSNIISTSIFPMVEANPTVSIRELQGHVESVFKFNISYRKVWIAKQKAIAKIYGNWEESYAEPPRWLQGVQHYMPGNYLLVQI